MTRRQPARPTDLISPSGGDTPQQELATYQALLDEAVQETFPASDPISPTAAMQAQGPVHTGRDEHDWALHEPSQAAAAPRSLRLEYDQEAQARRALDDALLTGLPSARLELPAPGLRDRPAAILVIPVENQAEQDLAESIARRSGARRWTTVA